MSRTGEVRGSLQYVMPRPICQAEALLSQDNPVSTQLYTVLDTTNAEIHAVIAKVTWGVTQPTPLDIVCTIDGVPIVFSKTNPVSNTAYYPSIADATDLLQGTETSMNSGAVNALSRLSGRTVLIQVRITWAVTQPTPLVCRVKYARW